MRVVDLEVMFLGLDMEVFRKEVNLKNVVVVIGVVVVVVIVVIIVILDGDGNLNFFNNNVSVNSFDGGYNNLDLVVDLVFIVFNLIIDFFSLWVV